MVTSQRIRLMLLLLFCIVFAGAAKAACTGSASFGTTFFLPSGGSSSASFSFSAASGCTYQLVSDSPSWLSVSLGPSSVPNTSTSASVGYTAAPNSGGYRKGTLTAFVNGAAVGSAAIEENGSACTITITSQNPVSVPASGGSGSFMFTDSGCEYVGPNSSASWLHVTAFAPFSISFSVDPNNGAARSATLSFSSPSGQSLTVNQAGNVPLFSLGSVTSGNASTTGGSIPVTVSISNSPSGADGSFSPSASGTGFTQPSCSGGCFLSAGGSSTLSLMFNPTGLNPGNFPVTITVTSSGPTATTTGSVLLQGTISVDKGTLTFNFPNPAAQTFTVTEAAAKLVTVGAGYSPADGTVNVSPGSAGTPDTVSVSALTSPGPGITARGVVTVTCNLCTTPSKSVNVVVNGPPASSITALGASPTSLNFSYQTGGTNPGAQTISVTGSPSAAFTVQPDSAWLSATPSGNTGGGGTVSVSVNGSLLPAGNSAVGHLTVACANPASCTNSPISILVNVSISTPAPTDVFSLDLQTINFGSSSNAVGSRARRRAGEIYTKTATLTNNTNNTLTVGVTANSDEGWLSANIVPTQVVARGTGLITVTADPSSLVPSAFPYSGSIVVTAGGLTKIINVNLTVNAVGPTGSVPVITSFSASPTSVSPGQTSTLSWSVSGATQVSIDNGVGQVNAVSGSFPVTPSSTTTYTLTASNSTGSATLTATITVARSGPLTGSNKIISQVVDGGSWQSTIVVVNRGPTTVTASLSFYMETGGGATGPWALQMLNNFNYGQIQLAPHSAVFMQTQGLGSNVIQGYGVLSGSSSTEAFGIFKLKVPGRQDQEGTATAATPSPTVVVPFDNAEQNSTSLAFVNPGTSQQTLNVTFLSTSGAASSGSLTVPAGGHTAFSATTPFGQIAGLRGVAVFTSSDGTPFTALAFRFNSTNAFTTVPVFPASGGGGTTILSQIADGGGWSSTVVLVNTGASFGNVRLNFQQDTAGGGIAPWSPSLNGQVVTSLLIAPGGSAFLETPGTAPTLTSGYATVTADTGIQAFAIFKQRVAGRQDQEGTATAFAPAQEVLVPFDNTNVNSTSLALVNTGQNQYFPAQIQGVQAGGVSVTTGAHTAFPLTMNVPSSANSQGLADFTSTGSAFCMLALRFNSSGAFTAVPVFPAASQ